MIGSVISLYSIIDDIKGVTRPLHLWKEVVRDIKLFCFTDIHPPASTLFQCSVTAYGFYFANEMCHSVDS